MQKILDEILLSDNVTNEFNKHYKEKEFKNWLISVLPEIKEAEKTEQDNPWHVYNVLNHILHSVEEMNKQTKNLEDSEKKLLAYTMFLHDIGKPQTKIRRYSKMYGREVDSFFDHNKASEKIVSRVLGGFGFNNIEQNIIKKLILDHDMFMFLTLKEDNNPHHKVVKGSIIQEKIQELNKFGDGEKLMKYLIMVGIADNNAQNKKMTAESLYKLTVIGNMLERIEHGKSL